MLEVQGEEAICKEKEPVTKKREPFAVRVVGRVNHLQEVQGEGIIFNKKGTISRKRESFECRVAGRGSLFREKEPVTKRKGTIGSGENCRKREPL